MRGRIRLLRKGPLALALLAVLAVAVAGAAPTGGQPRQRQRFPFETLESRTYELVNEHRRSERLPPLDYSRAIAAIARRHSEAMAAGRVPFGHEGFGARRRGIGRSIPLAGMAENVGVNSGAARRAAAMAVSGWLGSSGHRGNIEGDYDVTGIGIARGPRGALYFTQIFVKRRTGH